MDDNTICVVFCNPTDAIDLIKEDDRIKDSIVASNIIPKGEATVVSKDEFLDWLKGKKEC